MVYGRGRGGYLLMALRYIIMCMICSLILFPRETFERQKLDVKSLHSELSANRRALEPKVCTLNLIVCTCFYCALVEVHVTMECRPFPWVLHNGKWNKSDRPRIILLIGANMCKYPKPPFREYGLHDFQYLALVPCTLHSKFVVLRFPLLKLISK